MNFDGSVFLTEGEIGGNIHYKDGQPVMDAGLESAVYISLFSNAWWGNEIVSENAEKLEKGLDKFATEAATNQTRLRIISAAKSLLNWMIEALLADKIEVDASIDLDKFLITIAITKNEVQKDFKYYINWINQLENPAMTALQRSI